MADTLDTGNAGSQVLRRQPPDPAEPTIASTMARTDETAHLAQAARPAAHATLRGHIAIMRVDHWVKQVFVLPGIVAALSNGTSDIPGGSVVRVVARHGVGLPRVVEQLRHQRGARRAVRPLAPGQAQPTGAVGPGEHPASPTSSGSR